VEGRKDGGPNDTQRDTPRPSEASWSLAQTKKRKRNVDVLNPVGNEDGNSHHLTAK